MRKIIFTALFCFSIIYALPAQDASPRFQTNIFTSEDLMSLNRIGEFQISPDGKNVVYSMAIPNLGENKLKRDLYVVGIRGGESKIITNVNGSVSNPRWSPNNKQIAFISSKDGSPQIYVMDYPAGGEPTRLTNLPEGVATFAWSNDGSKIMLTADVKIDQSINEKYPALPKAKVRFYDKLPIRHWSEWEDESYSHVFVMDADGSNLKDLMPGEKFDTPMKPFGGAEELDWSPDGQELVYTCKKTDHYAENTNSDLYVYNLNSQKTTNITEGMPGYDQDPRYSPDRKYIAFISLRRPSFESDKRRLMLYDRESKVISEISDQFDQWIEEYVWAPNSNSIYFTATDSGTVKLFNINIKDKKIKLIAGDRANYGSGLDIDANGETIVVGKQSMIHPMDLVAINTKNLLQTQITDANSEFSKAVLSPKIEERYITSTDGRKVHCWVIYPPNFDPTKKYPLLTFLQGGPQSMISQNFHYRWNYMLMASKGYIIVAPNRRGVPGWGQDWNDAISKDWGGKPMQDIMSATDALAKEPYVDKEGLCAVGASAGGYAAYWLAGNHQKRYKAFVAHCGVFNFESMYGATEELWFPNWENGGPYWDKENFDYYAKNSPHKFVKNWDTPIFISTGEYDFRVPYTQSLEAYTAAQQMKVPSKIMIFPNETHFVSKPQEFIIWYGEMFDFLDKYCKH